MPHAADAHGSLPRVRYLPALLLGATGGALSFVVEDLSFLLQLLVIVLGVVVALAVVLVTSTAHAMKANDGRMTFDNVNESELDEDLLAAIAELKELGFQRSGGVLRPVASNYHKKALVVLMFNEDNTVVVEVGRICGPLMAAYWSVFDVGADKDMELWTLRDRIYNDGGPDDLWQSFPDADLATRASEHARAFEAVTALGVVPRAMNFNACKTGLKRAFMQNRARLLPSLTWNIIRMFGRALTKRSDYEGRIDEQEAGQTVMKRIAESLRSPA